MLATLLTQKNNAIEQQYPGAISNLLLQNHVAGKTTGIHGKSSVQAVLFRSYTKERL